MSQPRRKLPGWMADIPAPRSRLEEMARRWNFMEGIVTRFGMTYFNLSNILSASSYATL